MEFKNQHSISRLVLNGWEIALPITLKGGIVFSIVVFIADVISIIHQAGPFLDAFLNGNANDRIYNLLILFSIPVFALVVFVIRLICNEIFVFVITLSAGIGIAAIVFYGLKRGFMTEQKSFFVGISLGSLITLVLCILLSYPARLMSQAVGGSLSFDNAISWSIFAFYTIVAIGIAAVCGGLSAVKIYRNML